MLFQYRLESALHGLRRNRSRSTLTILGIVIGIAAIMIVMSVSQGGSDLIVAEVQGIGSRTVVIEPGQQPKGPSDFIEFLTDSLGERERKALLDKTNVPTLVDLTPEIIEPSTFSYKSETYRATVMGVGDIWDEIADVAVEKGRFLTADDIKEKSTVVVLGARLKYELFGNSEAIGERLKIKGKNFRVIGTLSSKGQGLFDFDRLAIVPYTAAKSYLVSIDYYNALVGRAESEAMVARTVRDIEATLRELHNITNPKKDDFHVSTQEDIIASIENIIGILSALLVSVAAISLIVGGIGIMNIMLVSVNERTREIGLRKALGGTPRDIMAQFLIESVILTIIGGATGILLGTLFTAAASIALSRVLNVYWPFTFPALAAFLGILMSVTVGLVFGIYPAKQAAAKSPIEALRYE